MALNALGLQPFIPGYDVFVDVGLGLGPIFVLVYCSHVEELLKPIGGYLVSKFEDGVEAVPNPDLDDDLAFLGTLRGLVDALLGYLVSASFWCRML